MILTLDQPFLDKAIFKGSFFPVNSFLNAKIQTLQEL